jgi:hypothetical protein
MPAGLFTPQIVVYSQLLRECISWATVCSRFWKPGVATQYLRSVIVVRLSPICSMPIEGSPAGKVAGHPGGDNRALLATRVRLYFQRCHSGAVSR